METSFGVNLCFSIKIIFDRVKRSFSTSSRRCRRQKKSSYFFRLIDCYFYLPFWDRFAFWWEEELLRCFSVLIQIFLLFWYCFTGIEKIDTLDRDGPISSVKLFTQDSSKIIEATGTGKVLTVLYKTPLISFWDVFRISWHKNYFHFSLQMLKILKTDKHLKEGITTFWFAVQLKQLSFTRK